MKARRVLIISYYWPPAGGISVQRSLKYVKFLREFGWEPVVYTAKNAHYPLLDPQNQQHVPAGIEIIRRPIREPFALYRKLTCRRREGLQDVLSSQQRKPGPLHRLSVWVRANFFIPDARSLWIGPSVRYLRKYLRDNPVDAIFSDGPPHTNTWIACRLSKELGIPWLADFQDPWTQVDYYQKFPLGPRADRKHRRMEQEVFAQASKITIASYTWKEDLESIGARDVSVLVWGYDDQDFAGLRPDWSHGEMRMVHTGLLGADRAPLALLEAIAHKVRSNSSFAEAFRLELIGTVDRSIAEKVRSLGLDNWVRLRGSLPRRATLQALLDAQLALLLVNQADNAKGRIPAKIFEYLGAQRPVLALGRTDGDIARILQETDAGQIFDYPDATGAIGFLDKQFERFKSGEQTRPYPLPTSFHQRTLTGQLAGYLDKITLG